MMRGALDDLQLNLGIRSKDGEGLIEILQLNPKDTLNDLHRVLGEKLKIPPESIQVNWWKSGSSHASSHQVLKNMRLGEITNENFGHGHYITYERLEAPLQHDDISVCDLCHIHRHVYHGYVEMAPGEWDAVVAVCASCGGRRSHPWEQEE